MVKDSVVQFDSRAAMLKACYIRKIIRRLQQPDTWNTIYHMGSMEKRPFYSPVSLHRHGNGQKLRLRVNKLETTCRSRVHATRVVAHMLLAPIWLFFYCFFVSQTAL